MSAILWSAKRNVGNVPFARYGTSKKSINYRPVFYRPYTIFDISQVILGNLTSKLLHWSVSMNPSFLEN